MQWIYHYQKYLAYMKHMKQKSTGTHKTTIIGTQENTENGKHYAWHHMQTEIRKASRVPLSLK